MITDFSTQMIGLYWHYKNGLLPVAGGILDQPDIYLNAMRVIDSAYNRIQLERQKHGA